MAETSAVHSAGSKLQECATSGGTYVDIAEVKSYRWGGTRGSANATHLLSPGTLMEKKPKFGDPGKITFSCNFTKTQFAALVTLFKAGTQVFWKVILPETSTMTPFKAHVSNLNLDVPEDDIITNDVELDCTGDSAAFTPAV